MKEAAFVEEFKKLLKRHKVWASGSLRLRDLSNNEWDKESATCELVEMLNYGYAKDRSGPFLKLEINQNIPKFHSGFKKSGMTLMDKDKLLADGIESPIDKTPFTNRREWKEHLKRNGCVEIGNDFNKPAYKPQEGDFNCRKELTQAIEQVAEKHGIRS